MLASISPATLARLMMQTPHIYRGIGRSETSAIVTV